MKNPYVQNGLAVIIIILFISLAISPGVNANIDIATASNQNKQSQKLTEEELHELRYMDIPMRYRYITEDGQIHTVTRTKSEFMAERTQYYREEEQPIISTDIGNGNHTPIVIVGNENFTTENGVTGGSGTENDPYLLEGWVIVGNGSVSTGIYVKNTDAYFVILNCSLSYFNGKDYAGIYLLNVKNGKIEGVDSFKNHDGISIRNSSYVTIINSKFHNNSEYYSTGIEIFESSYINISRCKSYNNQLSGNTVAEGIRLWKSSYCVIENSSCFSNDWDGIEIVTITKDFPSKYNTIRDCKVYDNGNHGVELQCVDSTQRHAGYNQIIGCEIYGNGFWPVGAVNAFAGIYIFNLNNNLVENCDIYDNGRGVEIVWSSHNIVSNCSIHDNWQPGVSDLGIIVGGWLVPFLQFAVNNTIEYCDIYNHDNAIWGSEVFNLYIHHNNIFNNSWQGIDVSNFLGFSSAYVNYNNIYGNGYDGGRWDCGLNAGMFSFVNAKRNWWGSPLGPSLSKLLPLRGDKIIRIYSIVLFRPWVLEPVSDAGVQ